MRGFDAKLCFEISVVDPGAVPGGSTKEIDFRSFYKSDFFGGAETGSTRVVKGRWASGIVPPLSGFFIVANDNYVQDYAIAA